MSQNIKLNKIIVISVIVLLVLCLIFLLVTGKKQSVPANVVPLPENTQREKTVVPADSVIKPPLKPHAQISAVKPRRIPKETVAIKVDTVMETSETGDTAKDSIASLSAQQTTVIGCAGDTVKPWVYPDPSGGLHRKAISVTFAATKPCTIEWKADSTAPWIVYKGESIPVKTTMTLFFRGKDTCGNSMEPREEFYELKSEETARFCPEGMEFILAGETRFCIDRYEWPNKKGTVPRSFISIYQATDSCVSVGRHLCTSDEWTLACTGPYGWRYPYAAVYEPHACVTQDTAPRPSGSRPECRGYFDVYDMAGNLAEWTNTKSSRNPQFYNVKGGFWESGPRSGCFDVRYSYYPQNRHNPVGFRCCKEARP
jgi:hypothetical protein